MERSEPDERDLVALFQTRLDRGECCIKRALGRRFGNIRCLGDVLDDFKFVHVMTPFD